MFIARTTGVTSTLLQVFIALVEQSTNLFNFNTISASAGSLYLKTAINDRLHYLELRQMGETAELSVSTRYAQDLVNTISITSLIWATQEIKG